MNHSIHPASSGLSSSSHPQPLPSLLLGLCLDPSSDPIDIPADDGDGDGDDPDADALSPAPARDLEYGHLVIPARLQTLFMAVREMPRILAASLSL